MKSLSQNWFTENPIDEEHKHWILLDYLQNIDSSFKEKKLYPPLDDLNLHILNLKNWIDNKNKYIKGNLTGLDFKSKKLIYETLDFPKEIKEIDNIVNNSIPDLKKVQESGDKILNEVIRKLKISFIGLIPQYKKEGYIFIKGKTLLIYKYSSFISRSLKLNLIDEAPHKFTSYENLKIELAKNLDLPNPMTILVESQGYPISETVIPILEKRYFSELFSFD